MGNTTEQFCDDALEFDLITNPVLVELQRRLATSPFLAIRKLRINFHEGVVILHGRVPTYYTLQVAISLAMSVTGVEQVDDRIVIDNPPVHDHQPKPSFSSGERDV